MVIGKVLFIFQTIKKFDCNKVKKLVKVFKLLAFVFIQVIQQNSAQQFSTLHFYHFCHINFLSGKQPNHVSSVLKFLNIKLIVVYGCRS